MQAFPVFAMKYATAINSTLVIPKRLFIIQKFSEEVTDYVFFENAHSHTVGTIVSGNRNAKNYPLNKP